MAIIGNLTVTFNVSGSYDPKAVYNANTNSYTKNKLKIMWSNIPGQIDETRDILIEIFVQAPGDGVTPITYNVDSSSTFFEWYPFENIENVKHILERRLTSYVKAVVSVPVYNTANDYYQGDTSIPMNPLRYSPYGDNHYSPQRVPYTFDCSRYVNDAEKINTKWNYYAIFTRQTSNRYIDEFIPNSNTPELIYCGSSSNDYINFDNISAKSLYDSGIESGDEVYLYIARAYSDGTILDISKVYGNTTRIVIDYYEIEDTSPKQIIQDNGDTTLSVDFYAPANSEKIVKYTIDGEEYSSYREPAVINSNSYSQNQHVFATLQIPFNEILKKNHNSNSVSVLEIIIKYSSGSYKPGVYGDNFGLEMSSYINVGLTASNRSTFRIIKSGKDIKFDLNGQFVVFNGAFNEDYIANGIAIVQYRNGDSKQLTFNSIKKVQFTDIGNRLLEGDDVVVDTDSALINVNGTTRHELGDISNDYDAFFLKPGENVITCKYSDWVESPPTLKLKYHEVFL